MKRKAILLTVICAMFSFASFGQSKTTTVVQEKDAAKLTDELKKELKLSDDQYKKIYEVNAQAVKNPATDAAVATKKATERDKKYKEILTAEQYAAYQKSMKKKVDATFEAVKKDDSKAVIKPVEPKPTPKPAPEPVEKGGVKSGEIKRQ